MGKVIAICTSAVRGVQKTPVQQAEFRVDWGIVNDAHAGHWHRQVSLLSADKIAAFREKQNQSCDSHGGSQLCQ